MSFLLAVAVVTASSAYDAMGYMGMSPALDFRPWILHPFVPYYSSVISARRSTSCTEQNETQVSIPMPPVPVSAGPLTRVTFM